MTTTPPPSPPCAGSQAGRCLSVRTQHEPLHNSMSDAFYEGTPTAAGAGDTDRPLASDPAVRQARKDAFNSMSEPEPLGNSMSGAGVCMGGAGQPQAACLGR